MNNKPSVTPREIFARWRWLLILLISGAFLPALAQEDNLVAGRDYIAINPPLPTRAGDKIEVLEFFNFSCPHCFRMQGSIAKWRAKADLSDVALLHQPVVFQRYDGHFARVYHTLVALGVEDEYYGKVFAALHRERQLINNQDRFVDWMEENGFDADKVTAVYDSFTVNTKVKRDVDIVSAYGIDSTPQMAVAGKYVLTPALSGSYDGVMRDVEILLARERRAQKE